MVLVLKNHQMENLLPMSEEIAAIEHAFVELGQGKAMNAPRAKMQESWGNWARANKRAPKSVRTWRCDHSLRSRCRES